MRSQHPSSSTNDTLNFIGQEKDEMSCNKLPTAPPAEQRAVGKMNFIFKGDIFY